MEIVAVTQEEGRYLEQEGWVYSHRIPLGWVYTWTQASPCSTCLQGDIPSFAVANLFIRRQAHTATPTRSVALRSLTVAFAALRACRNPPSARSNAVAVVWVAGLRRPGGPLDPLRRVTSQHGGTSP